MVNEALATILQELRETLVAVYGERLFQIILFGSQARNEASADSDIDILIVLNGEVDPARERTRTSELIAALSLAHDVVISVQFMPLARLEREISPFLINIRREGIAI